MHPARRSIALAALLLPALGTSAAGGGAGDDWPHWRGPARDGMAPGTAPLRWSDTENVRWRTAIPGRGFSTPLVLGGRIFLTTAVPTGEGAAEPAAEEPAEEGERRRGRGGFGGGGPQEEQRFLVLCLDRASGEVLWDATARIATPHEGYHHSYGSFASASPTTDGEKLWVSFGSQGLYCYTLDGDLEWEKDLGVQMRTRNAFGEGAAPIVHGDALIQVYDHEGDSFIVALDKRTGEERWRRPREEPTSWATPLIVRQGEKDLAIVSATERVRAYEIATGEVVWECGGLGLNVIPSPVRFEDTVLVGSGYRDPKLMAIELGREGDLTGSDAVRWSTTRGLAYTCSPVLHEGYLYMLLDRGFLSCFDARSGEPRYVEHRLPRGSNYKASPVGCDGRLYLAGENGVVTVVAMGPEPTVLAENEMGEEFFVSSPVIDDGEILLRSATTLFCIAEGASAAEEPEGAQGTDR